MNYNFLAHIIRDIFPNTSSTVIYGSDLSLKNTLTKPEHSIGAFQLHTERSPKVVSFDDFQYWEIGINDPYIEYGKTDLFISINYNPDIFINTVPNIAYQVKSLLKPNGKVFVVNRGLWGKDLGTHMKIDKKSTKEVKRYSMLKKENVLVYENI